MFMSAPSGYSIAAPPSLSAKVERGGWKAHKHGSRDKKTRSMYDALMGALALMPLMLLYIGLSHFEQAPAHHANDHQYHKTANFRGAQEGSARPSYVAPVSRPSSHEMPAVADGASGGLHMPSFASLQFGGGGGSPGQASAHDDAISPQARYAHRQRQCHQPPSTALQIARPISHLTTSTIARVAVAAGTFFHITAVTARTVNLVRPSLTLSHRSPPASEFLASLFLLHGSSSLGLASANSMVRGRRPGPNVIIIDSWAETPASRQGHNVENFLSALGWTSISKNIKALTSDFMSTSGFDDELRYGAARYSTVLRAE